MDHMADHHQQVALQQKEEDGIHLTHLMVMGLVLTMAVMAWVVTILHQLVVIKMTIPEKLMVEDMVLVDQIISLVIPWLMNMAVCLMVEVITVVKEPMDLTPTWVTQAPTVMTEVMDMVEQMDMIPMVTMEVMMVVIQHLLVDTHQKNMDHQVEPGPVMMNTTVMKAMGACPLMVNRVIAMVVQSQVMDHHRPQGVAMHPLPHTDTKSSIS